MVSSSSHGDYSEKQITGLDSNNLGDVCDHLYINGNKAVGIYISAASGSHTTHVITLQISPDGITWHDSAHIVTGIGYKEADTIAQYIRLKVTTAEGSPSTCDAYITSK